MPADQSYTIGRKEEVRQFNQAMEIVTMWRIWATSKGGTYFHIEVQERDLDKAPEILAAKAKQLDALR